MAPRTNLIHLPDEPSGAFSNDAFAPSQRISFTRRINRQGSLGPWEIQNPNSESGPYSSGQGMNSSSNVSGGILSAGGDDSPASVSLPALSRLPLPLPRRRERRRRRRGAEEGGATFSSPKLATTYVPLRSSVSRTRIPCCCASSSRELNVL